MRLMRRMRLMRSMRLMRLVRLPFHEPEDATARDFLAIQETEEGRQRSSLPLWGRFLASGTMKRSNIFLCYAQDVYALHA